MLLVMHGSLFAQAGSSGLAFLKLGPSGRGTAMGDATTAWISGADAVYYNPAGVHPRDGSAQLMLVHREWIQDTRMEHLAAAFPVGAAAAVGLSVSALSVSEIEIRTRPGPPDATFTARNISIGATYAQKVGENLRVGGTAKYLYEKILVDEASGFALDLGAQWDLNADGLSLGATLANLGSMGSLRDERTALPAYLRIGPASSFEFKDLQSTALLAADLQYIFPDSRGYVNIGGEFFYDETLALRSGYQFGSGARGYTGGIGIRYSILQVDYAYAPISYDLGDAHTIGVLFRF
jgi:hypothetical protein